MVTKFFKDWHTYLKAQDEKQRKRDRVAFVLITPILLTIILLILFG
jgi:hypothetical protein